MTRRHAISVCAAILVACGLTAAMAEAPRTVLVLYSNNRVLPANIEVDRGIRDVLAPKVPRVEIFSEFLDQPTFGGAAYDRTIATYLREKYATRPPEVIVVAAEDALSFVLRHRETLFPKAPVVHLAVARRYLQSMPAVPSDVVGVPVDYDPTGTLQMALRMHPDARRLLIVTGAGEWDLEREKSLRELAAKLGPVPAVEFVTGLPLDALERRLGALGRRDVVYTPGFFRDGVGRVFTPREAAGLIASASAAPVYGPYSTFIGSGVVGGRMPSYVEMGRDAGMAAMGLLDGVAPANLRLPAGIATPPQVDWRQVQRWGIDPATVPADAIVHFRAPTFWEAYRTTVFAIIAVIVVQAGLITALLLERRRRHRTGVALEANRSALAHMTRVSMMGKLSASIAHQLNQPLAAILGNAEAARKMLSREGFDVAELREICDDIITEDQRAAEVIRRLGALYKRGEMEFASVDVNELVRESLALAGSELRTRHVEVVMALDPALPPVDGGRVQLQQVLLNLVLNAADAMGETPGPERCVTVRTERDGEYVVLSVADRGTGIAPGNIAHVFDEFWTTKAAGMGIGLAICRAIMTAHRGTLKVANNPDQGATFRARWPLWQRPA